ncbi:MAG TPA: di-heme oxidoredictase family protein [Candidatus Binatia bacterium]
MRTRLSILFLIVLAMGAISIARSKPAVSQSSSLARDPGVRGGAAGAGSPYENMTANQLAFFKAGQDDFAEEEDIADGLGPTMNLDSCGGCHSFPALGGSSPAVNPQVAFATKNRAANRLPSFITADGPVREARFVRNPDGTPDGGVHALFTIAGRTDAPSCSLAQPDFARAVAANNVIFRIPTPIFGAGLIEHIQDSTIVANQAANSNQKQALGIRGRPNFVASGSTVTGQPNRNGNDGTIARFGWKAQNKSLLLFSGEAYNVEMGISNDLFQTERDETPSCQFAATPNSITDTDNSTVAGMFSSIEKFSLFMRFLAPPAPSSDTPGGSQSIAAGKRLFTSVGCALCHTPSLPTGNASVAAFRYQDVNLYSDLLIHDMGPGLADGISQGQAGPREFRTAPLWGLGQRIFFLHDGRTRDLLRAIQAHQSGGPFMRDASEANGVVQRFNGLTEKQKQDVLNFLRSL